MPIVFFPFHDYKLSLVEGFRTRDAHIYGQTIDNSKNKVIIVNRPTLFLEVLLKKKKYKTQGEVIYSNNFITIQKVTEKLFIIDIIDFSILKPVFKGKAFISELYFRNTSRLKEALNFLDCHSFTSYESSPLTRETVNFLSPEAKVFDGVDNFCKHDSYTPLREHLKAEYFQIIDSYDKIFFNGKDSLTYFNCKENENVEFMANGVDYQRFQTKHTCPELYNASKKSNKDIAVYAGKMQSMFDVNLVRELATANQHVDFYFLGKILEGEPDKDLADLTNVIFVGDVHYDLLPAYITHATICIIPYLVNKQHGGDPIKFYEYLASGNKIVSTLIGDIQKYHNNSDVFIIDRSEFLSSFKRALSNPNNNIHRVIPEHMSWQYKANHMFELSKAKN